MGTGWTCWICHHENPDEAFVCEQCKHLKAVTDIHIRYEECYPDVPHMYSIDDEIVAIRAFFGGDPHRGDGTAWPGPRWENKHRVMYAGWVLGDRDRYARIKSFGSEMGMTCTYDKDRDVWVIQHIKVAPVVMKAMLEAGVISEEESHSFTAYWQDTEKSLPEDMQLYNSGIQHAGWDYVDSNMIHKIKSLMGR